MKFQSVTCLVLFICVCSIQWNCGQVFHGSMIWFGAGLDTGHPSPDEDGACLQVQVNVSCHRLCLGGFAFVIQTLNRIMLPLHIQTTTGAAAILSCTQDWLATRWTPLSCDMAAWWQINSILPNNGRKNSIRAVNQYPFLWEILIPA